MSKCRMYIKEKKEVSKFCDDGAWLGTLNLEEVHLVGVHRFGIYRALMCCRRF